MRLRRIGLIDRFAAGIILRIHAEDAPNLTFLIRRDHVRLESDFLWRLLLSQLRFLLRCDVVAALSRRIKGTEFVRALAINERFARERIILVDDGALQLLPVYPLVILLLLTDKFFHRAILPAGLGSASRSVEFLLDCFLHLTLLHGTPGKRDLEFTGHLLKLYLGLLTVTDRLHEHTDRHADHSYHH